jgi:hypothetical protein
MTVLSRGSNRPSETKPLSPQHSRTDDASMGELTAQLSQQISRLVRDEMALVQLETKQRAKRIGAGVGMFGAGGILTLLASYCGVAAAVLGLSNVVQPWFAAVIVGAGLLLLAGLVVLPGWKSIRAHHPDVPHDSIESLKADVTTVKEAMRR